MRRHVAGERTGFLSSGSFRAIHVDRQADDDGPHIFPLQEREQRGRILREFPAHDHGAGMGEGEPAIRNRNADRLVAEIETGKRPAAFQNCRKLIYVDDIRRNGRFPLIWNAGVLS